MNQRTGAAVALVLLVALVGCTDDPAGSGAGAAASSTLSPGADIPQSAPAQQTGHLLVQVLTARCGISSISGTHAEFMPEHPLCRVRLRVVSNDSAFHTFVVAPQQLLLADGTAVSPHQDAMRIKRQPTEIELGGRNAYELDLWFSPASTSEATGLRVVGDQDEDTTGSKVNQAQNRGGVVLPLTGLGG